VDLQSELARRRDDQGQRRRGPLKPLGAIEKIFGNGEAIGDGLARAGLRRNQEVAGRRLCPPARRSAPRVA